MIAGLSRLALVGLTGGLLLAGPVQADQVSQSGAVLSVETEAGLQPDSWQFLRVTETGPDCSPAAFATAGFRLPPLAAETGLYRFDLSEADPGLICLRAGLAADPDRYLYLGPMEVVDFGQLTVRQRNDFLILDTNRPVAANDWRIFSQTANRPADCLIRQLPQAVVNANIEPLADRRAVLRLRPQDNQHWFCLGAVTSSDQQPLRASHLVTGFDQVLPVVTISQDQQSIQARSEPGYDQASWYYYSSPDRPNCRANPEPDPGTEADPALAQWSTGSRAPLNSNTSQSSLWFCFLVVTDPDTAGNRLYGYGLEQVNFESRPTAVSGVLLVIVLNLFIVCAGTAVGILFYRRKN